MFLNSVRLTSFCPNTQKPLAAPLANTKVYKIHCLWQSVKQYEKKHFLPKVKQLIIMTEQFVLYLMTIDWFMFLNIAVSW